MSLFVSSVSYDEEAFVLHTECLNAPVARVACVGLGNITGEGADGMERQDETWHGTASPFCFSEQQTEKAQNPSDG